VQQNILVSHSVVAPSLFGVAPEGSFNAAETADLFEVFKKTYVDARQRRLEWMINQMAELGGYIGQVKLKDVSPLVTSEAPAQASCSSYDTRISIQQTGCKCVDGYCNKIK
jgi:hypothetical protein